MKIAPFNSLVWGSLRLTPITMGKIPYSTCINQRGNVPVASLQNTMRLATGTKLSMSGNGPVASPQYKK